jgi:type II secretory pathway component PulF
MKIPAQGEPMRKIILLVGVLAVIFETILWFVVPRWIESLKDLNVPVSAPMALLITLSNLSRTPIGVFFFVLLFVLWLTVLHLMRPAKNGAVPNDAPPIPKP